MSVLLKAKLTVGGRRSAIIFICIMNTLEGIPVRIDKYMY
jgi:hypothetical protein